MSWSMYIGSIPNTAAAGQVSNLSRSRPEGPSLDNTAEALGLSGDDLKSQLKSGKTLEEISSAQGVSSDDLMTALKSDLKAGRPAGVPELSDDQLTVMATGIAAGKGPGGPGGPGGPPPPRGEDSTTAATNLTSLAESLGLSETDLLEKLGSGSGFASLLGNARSNPYTSSSFNVSGGLVVDQYA